MKQYIDFGLEKEKNYWLEGTVDHKKGIIIDEGIGVSYPLKQKPRILKSPLTNKYYYVDKYEDLGKGRFRAINKREATKEEIKTSV